MPWSAFVVVGYWAFEPDLSAGVRMDPVFAGSYSLGIVGRDDGLETEPGDGSGRHGDDPARAAARGRSAESSGNAPPSSGLVTVTMAECVRSGR